MKTFYTAIGGRMAKWKGKVVSFAPSVSASVSMGTTAAALLMAAPAIAQEVTYNSVGVPAIASAEQSVNTFQQGTGDIEAIITSGSVSSTTLGGSTALTTSTADNAISALVAGNTATSSLDIATLTGTGAGSNGVIASALTNSANDAFARIASSSITASSTDLSGGSSASLSSNTIETSLTLAKATNILSGDLSSTFANTDTGLVAVDAADFDGLTTSANSTASLLLQSTQMNGDVQRDTANDSGSAFSSVTVSDISLSVTDTAIANSVLDLDGNSLSATFMGATSANTLSVEDGGAAVLAGTAGISNVQIADNVGIEGTTGSTNAAVDASSGISAAVTGNLTSTSVDLTNNEISTSATQNSASNTLYLADGLSVDGQAVYAASNIDLVSKAAATNANLDAADLFASNVQTSVDSSIVASTAGDDGIELTSAGGVSGVSVGVTSNALSATALGNSTTGNIVVAGANSLDGVVAQANVQTFADATSDNLGASALATVSNPVISATVGSVAGSTLDNATITLNSNSVAANATANSATLATELSGNMLTDGVVVATEIRPSSATDAVDGTVSGTAGFSSMNAQTVTGDADADTAIYVVRSTVTDAVGAALNLTVGNASAILADSVLEMQGNAITSAARANTASQSLDVTANDMTSSAAVVGLQTLKGGVDADVSGTTLALSATADGTGLTDVANVTLDLSGNATSSLAIGNAGANSLAVSATSLAAIGTVVVNDPAAVRTAMNLDGLTSGDSSTAAQLSLLNSQRSTSAKVGDVISSDASTVGMAVTLTPDATTAGSSVTNASISMDANSLSSTARANIANNSMALDIGSLSLGSAVVDADAASATSAAGGTNIAVLGSSQSNTLAVGSAIDGASNGNGASDLTAAIANGSNAEGAISSTTVSADSNAITSLASGNSVTNDLSLKGTTIATIDAADLAPTLALDAFSASADGLVASNTAFAIGNDQSNTGAVTSAVNTGSGSGDLSILSTALGNRTTTGSTISADLNRIVAQAVAASDSTTASSIDATSIATSFLTASKQVNTGAVSATVGDADSGVVIAARTATVGSVGDAGTLVNSAVTASSNTIASTASAVADVTRLTLGGSQTATLNGAGGVDNGDASATTAADIGLIADYGLAQSQTNTGTVTADTDSVLVALSAGVLNDSSVAANSNLLAAMATAVSGTTVVTGTAAAIGGTTAPVFASVSGQLNSGVVSSTLEDAAVTMWVNNTDTSSNSETVSMDGNSLMAQATAVSGSNSLTTTADAQIEGSTDMGNAASDNIGHGGLIAEADRMLLSDQLNTAAVTALVAATSATANPRLEMTVAGATSGTTLSMASNAISGTATGATGTNAITSAAGASNAASVALAASQAGIAAVSSTITEPRLAMSLAAGNTSSAVDIALNTVAATATGLTETNRVAISGGSIDPVTGAASVPTTVLTGTATPEISIDDTFAALTSFQAQSAAVSATIADDGDATTPVQPSILLSTTATSNSSLAIASNSIAATATAGTVTNALSQVADTSINFANNFGGSTLASVQNGDGNADVTATIEGVTMSMTGTTVASSTIDITGNVANASATGFSAFNSTALVAGTSLTGDINGGGVASALDVLTVTETASLLANSQTNAGDVTALFDTSGTGATAPAMKVVLSDAVTGDSAIDVSGNTMRAQATGVLAQNISTLSAGLMTDVGAAVSNDQDASGAITATLGGPQFTISATDMDGTLATSNNIAVASATAASATNRLSLASDTSIDGAGATATTQDVLSITAGTFSTTDALALLNRQTSTGVVSSSVNGDAVAGDVAIGSTLSGSATGSISADSNILVAQSRGNIADSAVTLTAGSSVSDDTQAVLASSQIRSTGAISASVVGDTMGQIGIVAGSTGVAGSLSVSDNIVRATGSANAAINAMTVTGAAGIDAIATTGAATGESTPGAMTTNAQYAVMNGQKNASNVAATVDKFQIGIDADQGGTNTGSLALNGNMVMADATGNSAANSLKLYADGAGTDGSAALINYQVNSGAMSAQVTSAALAVASGTSNGSVAASNNAITASATGNVSTSVVSTAGSVFTSF